MMVYCILQVLEVFDVKSIFVVTSRDYFCFFVWQVSFVVFNIMNFSSRQKLLSFAPVVYGVPRFKVDNLIANDLSFLFKSQMSFESSVSFRYFSFRKDFRWLL